MKSHSNSMVATIVEVESGRWERKCRSLNYMGIACKVLSST